VIGQKTLWYVLIQCLVLLAPVPIQADIYRYVDSDGTIHFSNVPTSQKYEVYIYEVVPDWVQPSNRYDSYIAEAARKYDVPFSLIKAIIRVESDYDPNAVSRSGARGLMQIMPGTARDLGVTDSFDPRENILCRVRYLKKLLTRFRGSIPLALAAYNAGPGRVGPLRKVPDIEETQCFVRKVTDYFYSYKELVTQ